MSAGKKFIADFHIHSHFSIATSKKLIPEYLDRWARIKGIDVLGTGDCIHPGWLAELKEKLIPADNGLFRLKQEFKMDSFKLFNKKTYTNKDIFFILTGEISNIYKKNNKVRKVHNLCVFPDFDAVEKMQRKLSKFNIESDGRPIIGLDSKFLLEIVLNSSQNSFLVPAHIWTPWFSVLGSKSGFDNIKECYDDLTKHIFAVETGLSSDPAMNWTCSFLEDFKLISNSDAHSPEKLGREANLFETELSFSGIFNALSGKDGFTGTIEFFPQEGKYHYDGHRKCDTCLDPLETLNNNGLCPKCGKPVTKGVMYRVAELADQDGKNNFDNKRSFHSITSLPDILAELMDKKSNSNKTVQNEYFRLIERLGSEFTILLNSDIEEIGEAGGDLLAEAIKRLRAGNVIINEGYDGEYGRIKVFSKEELASFEGSSLFTSGNNEKSTTSNSEISSVKFNIKEFQALKEDAEKERIIHEQTSAIKLSNEQSEAKEHFKGPCIVLAGPGSGKTRILTERISFLIAEKNIKPGNILAVTFSNKAAEEIRERVRVKDANIDPQICTFHAFGLSVLKKYYNNFERPEHFYIVDDDEKKEIIEELTGKENKKPGKKILEFDKYKQGISENIDSAIFSDYNRKLQIRGAFDLDDLIYLPVLLFNNNPDILALYQKEFPWILVDEYQDINAKQFELLIALAGKNNPNLFVIGDPDQSIYGFRGSDVQYIDKLKNIFQDIKSISLPNSFRCPSRIIKAAGQVLGKKEFLTGIDKNIKINIQEAETEKSEADWIAAQIEKMIGGVRSFSIDSGISDGEVQDGSASFSDFAVLCRTSLMFEPITKAFADHGIAYQVIGTEPFYNTKPFSTIIRRFRTIYYHLANVKKTALKAMDETRQLIDRKENINIILNSLMKDIDVTVEERRRMEELSNFFGNDYEKFFLSLSMRHGIDEYNEHAEAVSLLTLHASKGLEFDTVFIPGCEDNIIPFELFGKKEKPELAEEERLLYVGMTRTKKNLYLTHSKKRQIKGRLLDQIKSRLLNKLEKELLMFGVREKKKKVEDDQLDLFIIK